MTRWDKIVNIGLIIIALFSMGWFLIHEYETHNRLPVDIKKEITESPITDWEPLIPGITSITLYFLKYFLGERRKRKKAPTLKDHIIFETIEDRLLVLYIET